MQAEDAGASPAGSTMWNPGGFPRRVHTRRASLRCLVRSTCASRRPAVCESGPLGVRPRAVGCDCVERMSRLGTADPGRVRTTRPYGTEGGRNPLASSLLGSIPRLSTHCDFREHRSTAGRQSSKLFMRVRFPLFAPAADAVRTTPRFVTACAFGHATCLHNPCCR